MRTFIHQFWSIAVALLLATTVSAQEQNATDLQFKRIGFAEQQIAFELPAQGPVSRYQATLYGPDNYQQQTDLADTRNFSWSTADLPDGHYTITFSPYFSIDPEAGKQLRRLTDQGEDEAVRKLRQLLQIPTSAVELSFQASIKDGKFIYPFAEEELFRAPMGQALHPDYSLTAAIDGVATALPPEYRNTIPPIRGNSQPLAMDAFFDQVFLDDLIVDGSACIGLDCVNGESFGFATLLLKENNLRIDFFDTSSSASFPSNDWTLEANSSENGGGNYFAIVDKTNARNLFVVEANAPSNSLVVDSGGRLGVGTGNPVVEVHSVDGDSPTLRLEQDGSSGFGAQIWDIAGNETNFFVRDVTNSSLLPFRIRPGAPTSSIDITADSVLIGNTLAANETIVAKKDIIVGGSMLPISDRRIKTNIQPLASALPILMQLQAKEYDFQHDGLAGSLNLPQGHQYGLIAQEVAEVLPHVVEDHFLVKTKENKEVQLKGINYTALIPFLVQGMQEQQAIIEQQEAELKQLRQKAAAIDDLYQQLEKLSAEVSELQQQRAGRSIQNQ